MPKTILQALQENQEKLTKLDLDYLDDKIKEKEYKRKRDILRKNVSKIIKDKNLIDTLKLKHDSYKNILK